MANFGTKTFWIDNYRWLTFDWIIDTQDAVASTTKISYMLQLYTGSSGKISGNCGVQLQIYDVNHTTRLAQYFPSGTGVVSVNLANNSSMTLTSGSATVPHNADGTGSFDYVISFGYGSTSKQWGINSSGWTNENVQTIDKINRGVSITEFPSSFTDEANPTIKYLNYAGSSASTLTATIQYDGYTFATRNVSKGSGNSSVNTYTFSLTDAERSSIVSYLRDKDIITSKITFLLTSTVSGVSSAYTSSKTSTVNLINYTPTLAPTVIDVNASTINLTGNVNKFVRYKSTAQYAINAVGRKGAYIENQSVTNGLTFTDPTGTIDEVPSGTFYFEAVDSEGESVSNILIKDLVEYVPLTCNLTVDIPTMSGETTVRISGNCFYGSFGVKSNTLTVKYRYRTDGAYSSWKNASGTIKQDNTFSIAASVTGLDYLKAYTFEAQVADALDTVYSAEYVISSSSVFDWSNADFNFNVPVNFSNGFTQPLSALKQLWNGNYQMESSSTSITLSMPISDLPNGIVLIFTPWNSSTATANDEKLMSFFVSKKTIQAMPSKLHTFFLMSGADFTTIGAKSLYIGHDSSSGLGKVTGYATNDDKGTKNGITFDNTQFVLRYVLGV